MAAYATLLSVATVVMVFMVVFMLPSSGAKYAAVGTMSVEPPMMEAPKSDVEGVEGASVQTVKAEVAGEEPTSRPVLDEELVKKGRAVYVRGCVMCHGMAGEGTMMGNDLTRSPWMKKATVEEIVKVIRDGRAATDPENVSKRPMPAKGGVPGMNEAQVRAVAEYCRSVVK